jgi:hypothetical protein
VSSGDITVEQECSTDIVYLSTYLKAVIEGSTLDQFSKTDQIAFKLLTIARETQKYLKKFIRGNSSKVNKTSGFKEQTLKQMIIDESPVKVANPSEFSFSSPDVRDNFNENKDLSVSSDWRVEGDLVSQNLNESAKWNSISVINVHTSSISQGSEASESVELLNAKNGPGANNGEKSVGCFRRLFCCMCKESNN